MLSKGINLSKELLTNKQTNNRQINYTQKIVSKGSKWKLIPGIAEVYCKKPHAPSLSFFWLVVRW